MILLSNQFILGQRKRSEKLSVSYIYIAMVMIQKERKPNFACIPKHITD